MISLGRPPRDVLRVQLRVQQPMSEMGQSRHVDILFGHAALNFVGTSEGVDHAGELGNSAVPGILDNTSVMLSDFGIENRSSKRFQSRQRAFFVDPYQAARARDIRRQNSRQSPLYMIAAQDAPPRLGEIECSYRTIVGSCPAMRTSEMGQFRPNWAF